ncbi:GNAT family N-acetyltransferase [Streptomyces virginiae]|uniref:GNAT family N-acetyltransferase n=1 Tax=Streptomyces virginiae TaxID=1961 RepID=UPI0036C17942
MRLLPFSDAHAAVVADWPASAGEVALWCGRQEFPVAARTVTGWQRDADVQAHVLVDGGRVVGYGELWFDADEDEVELARIIVAPDTRGRGLGRVLVRGLLARAVAAGHADVFMRVHPDNARALRCYRGAGFAPVDPALAEAWNEAQPVGYVWLQGDTGAPEARTGTGASRP